MTDTLKKVGRSILHYGKENDRIYLMRLSDEDFPGILEYMNNLAFCEGYSKITTKIPEDMESDFINDGYEKEAFVKGYYEGDKNCCFMCKYLSDNRKDFSNVIDADIIRKFCLDKVSLSEIEKKEEHCCVEKLDKKHIPKITEIFSTVFETYPFPIFDGRYIQKTMDDNIEYFGVFEEEKLVAVSSSEMDFENLNSEMTDFAVLPEYRGNNYSYHLLKKMEETAANNGILTLYSIARSLSKGMNITFSKAGYTFGGKLINNTNICGKIQTMNVWYKTICSSVCSDSSHHTI